MPVLGNQRHELFAQAVAKGASATAAYREAGYEASGHAAESNASRLLRKAEVAGRVAELQGRAAEKAVLTRQWVLERLVENANRAMQATAVKDADGGSTGEYRYEGSVANRALELLGKELGMFVDRREIGQPGDFARMTNEELGKFVAEEVAALGMKTGTHH